MTSNIIPIMHCFNNDYVIPAGVAFYSMLEHANKNYFYKLYVLHSDITEENQELLYKTIEKFSNATLEFIDMNNKFEDLFKKTKFKGHFSKEMFYKFLPADIFYMFDKIIITDVDVVYVSDISKLYENFDIKQDYYLLAPDIMDEANIKVKEKMYKKFSKEEINKLQISAGFMIYNLKKMREDAIPEKLIQFAIENSYRIMCPEQDALNLVCYPKIKFMDRITMSGPGVIQRYKNDETLKNTIQFHYGGVAKPWKAKCIGADLWFKCLLKTPCFDKYMEILEKNFNPKTKTIFSFSIPFYKKKISIIKSPK